MGKVNLYVSRTKISEDDSSNRKGVDNLVAYFEYIRKDRPKVGIYTQYSLDNKDGFVDSVGKSVAEKFHKHKSLEFKIYNGWTPEGNGRMEAPQQEIDFLINSVKKYFNQ